MSSQALHKIKFLFSANLFSPSKKHKTKAKRKKKTISIKMKNKSLYFVYMLACFITKLHTKHTFEINNEEFYGREHPTSSFFETPFERLTNAYIKFIWSIRGKDLSQEEIEKGLLLMYYILDEMVRLKEMNKQKPPEYWHLRLGK